MRRNVEFFIGFRNKIEHRYERLQRWLGGLQQEGVATPLLQVGARDRPTVILRAKKAAACLLWMSGRSRQEIEMQLMQHMRENAAAGAMNQVRSRTIDLLPVVVSAAEILRDIDLADRQTDLMLRLELGITHDLLGIARPCRGRLARAEYLRLRSSGLGAVDVLAKASVDDLAEHLGGDQTRANSVLDLVRAANEAASVAA